MKLRGFLEEYDHGILPLGPYDFIGTLIMLCEKKGDELEPVFCFKSSTLDRVKYFNLPFELMEWFHTDAESKHESVVKEILERAECQNINIGYNSSWTIAPSWRKEPEWKTLAKELSVAVFVHYYQSRNISEILIAGSVRFKVDKIQAFLGFDYLSMNGERLPPIDNWIVKNEQVTLMYLTRFSDDALKLAEKFKVLWAARLEVIESAVENQKIAA